MSLLIAMLYQWGNKYCFAHPTVKRIVKVYNDITDSNGHW